MTNKTRKQRELNELNENIKTIDEKNIIIKRSVRFLISNKQMSDNEKNLNNQLNIHEENFNKQLSDQKENFMMLSNNDDSDSDYDMNFDDEFIEDMNM